MRMLDGLMEWMQMYANIGNVCMFLVLKNEMNLGIARRGGGGGGGGEVGVGGPLGV